MIIKEFSDSIANKAFKEAMNFPIDRNFLQPFLKDILSFDRNEFLIYNLENQSSLYSTHLMLCLPELWEDLVFNDLLFIFENLKVDTPFYSIILFTYKFVEIDIIDIILKLNFISESLKDSIRTYIASQYLTFLKSDTDFLFFEEGVFGVKNDVWMYIKQKMLLDTRISPACTSIQELNEHFSKFGNNIK